MMCLEALELISFFALVRMNPVYLDDTSLQVISSVNGVTHEWLWLETHIENNQVKEYWCYLGKVGENV